MAKNGVPWHVAQSWSPGRRLAALVVIGQSNGGTFDWNTLRMEYKQ